jgi:hypothetical protein
MRPKAASTATGGREPCRAEHRGYTDKRCVKGKNERFVFVSKKKSRGTQGNKGACAFTALHAGKQRSKKLIHKTKKQIKQVGNEVTPATTPEPGQQPEKRRSGSAERCAPPSGGLGGGFDLKAQPTASRPSEAAHRPSERGSMPRERWGTGSTADSITAH